jgi:hypothetical protein
VTELLDKAEAALDNTIDRGGAKMTRDHVADLRARRTQP